MESSEMRCFGFSTGSLSKGRYQEAIAMLARHSLQAIEVSALREDEFSDILQQWGDLDLGRYQNVSFHAPSRLREMSECNLVEQLTWFSQREIPIVVHPDMVHNFTLWRRLGPALLIENMDRRKPVGRTADELSSIFAHLPDARLCLDLGHAKQVDPSMHETRMILKQHGSRLAEVHLSEVNSLSGHESLNELAISNFKRVAHMIPATVPIILESPVAPDKIQLELRSAERALPVFQLASV